MLRAKPRGKLERSPEQVAPKRKVTKLPKTPRDFKQDATRVVGTDDGLRPVIKTRRLTQLVEVLQTYGATDTGTLADRMQCSKSYVHNLAMELLAEEKIEEVASGDRRKTVYQLVGHDAGVAQSVSVEQSTRSSHTNGATIKLDKYFTTDDLNMEDEPVSKSLKQYQVDHVITPKVRYCYLKDLIDDQYPQTTAEMSNYLGITKAESEGIADDLLALGAIERVEEGKVKPTQAGVHIVRWLAS